MYNHNLIEKKWLEYWEKNQTNYFVETKQPKYFVMDAFPYPSGTGLHIGHIKAFSGTDFISRYKKMSTDVVSTVWGL
jgi:leucyl-tRNA synthetase